MIINLISSIFFSHIQVSSGSISVILLLVLLWIKPEKIKLNGSGDDDTTAAATREEIVEAEKK